MKLIRSQSDHNKWLTLYFLYILRQLCSCDKFVDIFLLAKHFSSILIHEYVFLADVAAANNMFQKIDFFQEINFVVFFSSRNAHNLRPHCYSVIVVSDTDVFVLDRV